LTEESQPRTPAHANRIARWLSRDRLRVALQLALISLLASLVGERFTALFHGASASIGALWCAITAIATLQATRPYRWREGLHQLLGTLIGALIGGLYLSLFPFSPLGIAICVGLTALLCEGVGINDSTKLAAISVVVVMVISYTHPALNPLLNSALRFFEACIGVGIAMLASLVSPAIE
jgi:uncharacterized membrane protein YccC